MEDSGSRKLLSALVLALLLASFGAAAARDPQKRNEARFFHLSSEKIRATFTNYGATIVSVEVPDARGQLGDIVLGFDNLFSYLNGSDGKYFGAIVGRVANRIKGAQYQLNGTTYHLPANDGNNTLHGGIKGFDKVMWTVRDMRLRTRNPFIQFTYHSYDGEQGFGGALDVSVTYTLMGSDLKVEMVAHPKNKATPVNLAQHTYWNLAGQASGRSILGNRVRIWADSFTPVDSQLIPTGAISPVKNTPYDFTTPDIVGSRIDRTPNGYDINYVLDGPISFKGQGGVQMRHAVTVKDDFSGRVLDLYTDAPGLQFYTSGMLDYVVGKGGAVYVNHSGMCLETQHFPDSVHHPNFPSIIYSPGQLYRHNMLYRFSVSPLA